ncbi:MAG TPA: hypothetical protein VFR28_05015, partial [Allosphingosinicella sp.]|nr:hypothetical protein [Allosphingosinicella sp.]
MAEPQSQSAFPARPRMLVLCPYPEGVAPGQRLKFEQYYPDWRAMGFEVEPSPFMDMALWRILYVPGHLPAKAVGVLKGYLRRARDLFRIRAYDVVYVHMWATPFGTTLFERMVRKLSKRLIFDLEDNVLVGASSDKVENPNPILRYLKGSGKPRYLVAESDHVIASSPFLSDQCQEMNRRR